VVWCLEGTKCKLFLVKRVKDIGDAKRRSLAGSDCLINNSKHLSWGIGSSPSHLLYLLHFLLFGVSKFSLGQLGEDQFLSVLVSQELKQLQPVKMESVNTSQGIMPMQKNEI
jgi:hypothetical protein